MLDTDTRAKLRSLLPQVLARRLNEAGAELGTTAYCLHAYLLQKLYLVPLGYRFKLYPEGPQCDEVLGDLDLAKSRNEVQIDYIQGTGAIRILPGLKFHERPETESPLVHYAQQMDELIATFGNCNARELDLRTAIISVWSLTRPSDEESAEEALDLARVLKPHGEESEIRAAMDELRLMPAYVARTEQGTPRKTARKEKSTNKRYHSSTAADSGWVEARNQVAKLPPAVPSRHTKPLQ